MDLAASGAVGLVAHSCVSQSDQGRSLAPHGVESGQAVTRTGSSPSDGEVHKNFSERVAIKLLRPTLTKHAGLALRAADLTLDQWFSKCGLQTQNPQPSDLLAMLLLPLPPPPNQSLWGWCPAISPGGSETHQSLRRAVLGKMMLSVPRITELKNDTCSNIPQWDSRAFSCSDA